MRSWSRPMSSNVSPSTLAAAVFTRPTPGWYTRQSARRRLGSTSASSRAGREQCRRWAQMRAGARRSSLTAVILIRLSHANHRHNITYLQIACFSTDANGGHPCRTIVSETATRLAPSPREPPNSRASAGDGPQPGEPFVPKFRAFCLTPDDRIEWGLTIDAPNLQAAIAAAHRACQEHFRTSASRVEIWRRADKLYTSPPEQDYR